MHLSPAAKESAIRLLELDVRGEKRGEIEQHCVRRKREVDQQRNGGSAWESNPKPLNMRNQATTHANSSFRPSDR